MSAAASAWAWKQISGGACGTPLASLVLLRLADRADPDGRCWPGHERTARDCSISPRAAQTAVHQLSAAGLLQIDKRYNAAGGLTSNLYSLQLTSTPLANPATHPAPPAPGGGKSCYSPSKNLLERLANPATESNKESKTESLIKNPAPPVPNTQASPTVRVFNEIEIFRAIIEKGLLTEQEENRIRALAKREKNGQQLVDELVEQLHLRGRHPNGQIVDPIGYFIRLKTSTGLTRAGEGESRRIKFTPMLSIGELLTGLGAPNVL